MPRWSKSKAEAETKLPPLTTEGPRAGQNWHKVSQTVNPEPAPLWTVLWDTSRNAGTFNKAHHMNEAAAIDCAKRFLRMGFVVYSIKDAAGTETMDEAAINRHFRPESVPEKSRRFAPRPLGDE